MGGFIHFAALAIVLCVALRQGNAQNPIVECKTTQGMLAIEVFHDWAPLGADRFLELVRAGFYTDIALFRCVHKFLVQFGISDKPEMKHWHNKNIRDDPNQNRGIKQYYVSYAGGGPNTRSTQLFIAFEDLDFLGKEPWEVPFGRVIAGKDAVGKFYKGYGDIPPFGPGPDQQLIHREGNSYIHRLFPKTDFIEHCRVVEETVYGDTESELEDFGGAEINFGAEKMVGIGDLNSLHQLRTIGQDKHPDELLEDAQLQDVGGERTGNVRAGNKLSNEQHLENMLYIIVLSVLALMVIFRFVLPALYNRKPASVKSR